MTPAKAILVEVFRTEADGRRTYSTFSISADCARILVDADRLYGDVWGFTASQEQADGELVEIVDDKVRGISDS